MAAPRPWRAPDPPQAERRAAAPRRGRASCRRRPPGGRGSRRGASAVRNIGSDRMRRKPLHPRRRASAAGAAAPARSRAAGTAARARARARRTSAAPAGGGSTSAAPSAAPMNGPVQGVATKAASAPVQKAPRVPPLAGQRVAAADRRGSSNRPARLSAIAVTSSSSSRMTRGSCSWNAQPTVGSAGAQAEQGARRARGRSARRPPV